MRNKVFFRLVIAGIFLISFMVPAIAQKHVVNIALHDSPWLPAFRKLVPLYEQETGNKIKLHIFPYSGLYEKEVAEVTTGRKTFDIMFIDDSWGPFFFGGGYMTPLKEIDPGYEKDPEIIEYDYAGRWSFEKRYSTVDGELMGLPINGNIHLLYYRPDKFEETGLSIPPLTWKDVESAAQKLYDLTKPFYGYVHRGERGNPVVFNFLPVLRSFKTDIFADPPSDWTITINSEKAKRALKMWVGLTKWAPPGIGNVGQSDIIAMLVTGRAAQAITVAASWPWMDDPEFSTIPYKVGFAITPKAEDGVHAPAIGMWIMAIPKVVENKEVPLDFMKWVTSYKAQMEYARAKAVPIRADVYRSSLAEQKEYRWMKAYNDSFKFAKARPKIMEWFQIEDVLGLHLNRALIGGESSSEALDATAREIYKIMAEAGYKTIVKE